MERRRLTEIFYKHGAAYRSVSVDGAGPWPCTTCRSDVNTGDKFCITCGASYNELQCPSCNAQLTVGFSCTQCGETLDWDQFFGIQQNAERPSPADRASGPGQDLHPPVWIRLFSGIVFISVCIIVISLVFIGIGGDMADFGWVFIQYGVIGFIIGVAPIQIRMYIRGRSGRK